MQKRSAMLVFGVLFLQGVSFTSAQERPRPRESDKPGAKPEVRADKYAKGQNKGKFNDPARGNPADKKIADKDRPGGKAAEVRADKWDKGQNKGTFNRAANPPKGPDGKPRDGGDKNGAPPSPPPGPKPK
jgi:hypothetical protein